MALVQINWRPDRNELRKFGYIGIGAFGLLGVWLFIRQTIFGMALPPGAARAAAYACWALAAWSLAGALAAPAALRPLYVGLTAISLPIGFVVSHVLMAVVFYGLLTPIALFFRMIGRDALQRRLDPSAATYWQTRRMRQEPAQYFRQF